MKITLKYYKDSFVYLKGDAGAPFVHNKEILGLLVYKWDPINKTSGVYINIYEHRDFINSQLEINLNFDRNTCHQTNRQEFDISRFFQ